MLYKGCKRCGGDMFKEDDLGETELVCLQCGSRHTLSLGASAGMSADVAKHLRRLLAQRRERAAA